MSRTIEDLLTDARSRIIRWSPWETLEPIAAGAILVDIRPRAQREEHGEVPVGVVVERNVLEWRLDPASPWRLGRVDGHERIVIVLCQEGYASSLAAASLLDLGYRLAGDVEGGFEAWKNAGLPTRPARREPETIAGAVRGGSVAAASTMHRWRGPTSSRPSVTRAS